MSAPYIAPQDASLLQLRQTQNAHGFTAGRAIYNNAGTWALARSDAQATLPTQIVSKSISANVFQLAQPGETITTTGLTAGQVMHVSGTTAGAVVGLDQGLVPASAAFHAPVGEATSATTFIVQIGSATAV